MWTRFRLWVDQNDKAVRFLAWGIGTVVVAITAAVAAIGTYVLPSIENELSDLSYSIKENVQLIDAIEQNRIAIRCRDNDIGISANVSENKERIIGVEEFKVESTPIENSGSIIGYDFEISVIEDWRATIIFPLIENEDELIMTIYIVCMRRNIFE